MSLFARFKLHLNNIIKYCHTHVSNFVSRDLRNGCLCIYHISTLPCFLCTPNIVPFAGRKDLRNKDTVDKYFRVRGDFQKSRNRTCNFILTRNNLFRSNFLWKFLNLIICSLHFTVISGVPRWTLSADVTTSRIAWIFVLTARTEVVRFD